MYKFIYGDGVGISDLDSAIEICKVCYNVDYM
jgi:hypothetical protein